jgi:hypothetical protein
MLTNKDIEKLNSSIKSNWAIYVIDQRSIAAFKGYLKLDEKILRYTKKLKKDFMLSILSLGGDWAEINASTANIIIQEIAKKSIVYDNSTMSETESEEIANKFLLEYNEDCIYLTNGLLDRNSQLHNGLEFKISVPYTNNEVSAEEEDGTGYLFCSTVIAFDTEKIGIFCKCESD